MNKLIIATIFLGITLLGCQRVWYVVITDATDPGHPHFCISRFKNCSGKGIGFAVLDFFEVTSNGNKIKSMWSIEPIQNVEIKQLVYGVPPEGWRELHSAIPIEIGHWYTINFEYFFKFTLDKGMINTQVLSREEFYSKR